jgi:hypothetical protein
VNSFLKAFDPGAWRRAYTRFEQRRHSDRLRLQVESGYRSMGPVTNGNGPGTVIADGMWDNPNHFFRLRLFLEALPDIKNLRLLGVLRRHDDRTRRTMETMGFREFIFIEEHGFRTEDFLPEARTLLSGVRTHADLLKLALPEALPAYTYYDTVLKFACHPQPPLDDPLWLQCLAETLRNLAIYKALLEQAAATHVVLSHPWKNEFAALMWTALKRGIPAYHLTGYCEGIRVRRFLKPEDYFTPVEHLSYCDYLALTDGVRSKLRDEGAAYLEHREAGTSTDINARCAFRPDLRHATRAAARQALGGQPGRPLAVIYSHVWFDFPHTFAMSNFTDFLDWMRFTIEQIRRLDGVDWVLKPHPTERWYGGFRLADLLDDLPPHVRIVADATDSLTTMLAADAVITVHGTVGLEAAAHGLPVIAADRSYYADWGFVHVAGSRAEYAQLLASVGRLPPPGEDGQAAALACTALALAPTPSDEGMIELRCDSSGAVLFEDILGRQGSGAPALNLERQALGTWLRGNSSSYSADLKIKHFARQTQ